MLSIQLQKGEEASHHNQQRVGVGHQRTERGRLRAPKAIHDHGSLLPHAHLWYVQMPQAHLLCLLGSQGQGCHRRELFGSQADQDFGKQRREVRFEGDAARDALAGVVHLIGQQAGHLLVCAVLKQAREQQVSSFQKGQILLVLYFPAGKQARRLQIQQRRRDNQKTGRLVQIPIRTLGLDVADELVGYLVQRQLGDLELVFRDQRQQEVEGAFEAADLHRETAPG